MKPTPPFRRGTEPPAGYVALIQTLMRLIVQWCGEQPGLPDLRWLDPGTTCFIRPLRGEAVRYLADSPDAFRLVEWLDVETGRQGTLAQLTVALQLLGHLPGGPEPESVRESAAFKRIAGIASDSATVTRVAPSPCGHCGKSIDAATGEAGRQPEPGHFSICFDCCGINQYQDGLRLRAVDEAKLETLPAEHRAELLEMQALVRAARMGAKPGKTEVQA